MIQGVLSEDRGKGSEQGRRCLCLGECALWSWRGEGYLDTHASVGRKFRSSSQVGQDATCVAICCIFKLIRMECDPSHLALPSSSISHHLSPIIIIFITIKFTIYLYLLSRSHSRISNTTYIPNLSFLCVPLRPTFFLQPGHHGARRGKPRLFSPMST